MQSLIEVFEFILDFSSIIMLLMLISLVNIGLKWLPSLNKMNLFLILFLLVKLLNYTFLFLSVEIADKLSLCIVPCILLLGPLMTRFTHSTLLMQKTPLLDTKSIIVLIIGCLLLSPFIIYPFYMTELPKNEQPWLLVFSDYAFVLLFIITSSTHFISMLFKFYQGSLYSVGYDNQTYIWLKGVWLTMTFLWLSLLHNMISGVIDIPWESLGVSWLAIDIFTSLIDIFVLFGLTILTVLFCKKPVEKPIVELCEISDKYEKSALSKEHALDILKLVDNVMHKHHHFLDNSLNIEKLAKEINAPSQYLSQAINQYRQINFYELIASYRIEYAKEILLNQPEKNILTVAMDAGFNAKSTFNKTFKKITGLTPSEYKKSNALVSN